MAGQAIAIADGFPQARIIGVEPAGADDFRQSLAAGWRSPDRTAHEHLRWVAVVRRRGTQLAHLEAPGEPVGRDGRLGHATSDAVDLRGAWATNRALRRDHRRGLVGGEADLSGDGDVVVVISGRNVDDDAFRAWIKIDEA